MQQLVLEHGDSMAFRYEAGQPGRDTFVTFNALTQSLEAWDAMAEHWRAAGHGVLRFDLRGQPGTTAAAGLRLDVQRIVADARALLDHVQPPRPVLVGLSIGGLFAARTVLDGAPVRALVLLNTLRRPGPRLAWINDAVLRCMELGGGDLVRDLFAPVLMSENTLVAMRPDALAAGPYRPLPSDSPLARLVRDCVDADWDVPYEDLQLPVLVVTGLQDRLFFEAEAVNQLTLRMPNPHRVDFDDAGHLVPAEKPVELAEAIMDFSSTL